MVQRTTSGLDALAILLIACLGVGARGAPAQSRRAHKEAQIADSAKPRSVSGGVILECSLPYDKAYDAVLTHLKRQGYSIDSADRDVGQIVTAMQVTGGYSQTGTRTQISLIRENGTKTTIRVAVTQQKRKKALQAEPWSEPKISDSESSRVATELKAALTETGT